MNCHPNAAARYRQRPPLPLRRQNAARRPGRRSPGGLEMLIDPPKLLLHPDIWRNQRVERLVETIEFIADGLTFLDKLFPLFFLRTLQGPFVGAKGEQTCFELEMS